MERPRALLHAATVGLEAILLLALIDAQRAFDFSCVWCGTPPLPPAPMLPADFWRSVFGFLLLPPYPGTLCIAADLAGPLLLVGAALAAHAFYLINAGRRIGQP